MNFNGDRLSRSRNLGPFAREPLYKLGEIAEKLDISPQKCRALISAYKIEPAIKSRGVGRWKLSDFQRAYNAEFGVEKFKVEKAVPITPVQVSRTKDVVNKLIKAISTMEVGDRISIEEETSHVILTRLRSGLPDIKLVSRKDPKDPSTRWVWRAS